jgi:cell division protein FtsQ
VASGGRVERGSRDRARAENVVIPLPRRITGERLDLVRLVPSGRSLGIAFLVAIGAILVWYGARETGVFSVRAIDVAGAPGPVKAQVRHALADTRGTSLLKVDLEAARQRVEALPTIRSARFDRAYPHTLHVVVVPERPVAVVRQGADSYLVAASGRIVADVGRRSHPTLARIWVGRTVVVTLGDTAGGDLSTAIAAVAPIAGSHFPGRVTSVTTTPEELTLRLRSGLEVRLGDATDAALKLAVAARVIPLLDPGTLYLDVAVPERPVSGTLNSQVEGETAVSTGP